MRGATQRCLKADADVRAAAVATGLADHLATCLITCLASFLAVGLMAWLALTSAVTAVADERPKLSLPIACMPHKTCFIQNYVDIDPSKEAHDFGCGTGTYDKHTGTDFRVLSIEATKAGVPVLASADGTVKAVRDGVSDILMREAKGQDYKGRECGNGVIIDHGQGWETQYCHMKQGSLRVSVGQAVKRGEPLGNVGYSGMADFAHVHLSVRHAGKVVDPFHPDGINGACLRDGKTSGLWAPSEIAAFPYRNGEIIQAGFAAGPLDHNALETDHTRVASPTPASPALIFYGRLLNLLADDRVRITIIGPGGPLVEELTEALERPKATYTAYAGKKLRGATWTPGRYTGQVEIVRDGAVVAASVGELMLR